MDLLTDIRMSAAANALNITVTIGSQEAVFGPEQVAQAQIGAGTHLIMNEQGAFLDGYDDAGSRERGSQEIMDKLSAYLEG